MENQEGWCPHSVPTRRPLPYHGSALPTELYGLSRILLDSLRL